MASKQSMCEAGYCEGCCAWSKLKVKCRAMSEDCPVPDDITVRANLLEAAQRAKKGRRRAK